MFFNRLFLPDLESLSILESADHTLLGAFVTKPDFQMIFSFGYVHLFQSLGHPRPRLFLR